MFIFLFSPIMFSIPQKSYLSFFKKYKKIYFKKWYTHAYTCCHNVYDLKYISLFFWLIFSDSQMFVLRGFLRNSVLFSPWELKENYFEFNTPGRIHAVTMYTSWGYYNLLSADLVSNGSQFLFVFLLFLAYALYSPKILSHLLYKKLRKISI